MRKLREDIRYSCWPLALALCTLAGCADPNVGTVTGSILIDDEPAETGSIVFASADGKTGPVGTAIVDGKYTVDLPVGSAKVEIRVPVVVGQQKLYDTPDSKTVNVMEESLPNWYNDETELTYEIPSGESVKDFELSRKKRKKKRS